MVWSMSTTAGFSSPIAGASSPFTPDSLAPIQSSDPSAADLSVAGAATQIEAQAWSAIARQQRAASTGAGSAHTTSSYPKGSLVNAVA
jgi:hypothetical protein